ncbi:hypothetical protein SAMN02745166_01608 [Prosthecobacter debontii]|uniref:Type II secretion system protein n=2 Tax=Prosthecobacter debontii TaxID=48467 RepID=A0A1T4XJM2_9BACT|nr:hypothetical protein SAMN02745166_01608 [Prosthecobacter debontii]
MSELIIAISILGILAGIVIVRMWGAFGASQETLATSRVEMLNSALHSWSSANREMSFMRRDETTSDELVVLRDLQYRNPNQALASVGSPYVPPEYNPGNSSSDKDFRIRWNGRTFELVRPGEAGTGLLMVFDGSDFTEPFPFPENYQSSGR